jgi:hypothetical protein
VVIVFLLSLIGIRNDFDTAGPRNRKFVNNLAGCVCSPLQTSNASICRRVPSALARSIMPML